MKILQRTIRKEKGRNLFRFILKYENGKQKRTFSVLENSRRDAENKMNFRLAALTAKADKVDISEMVISGTKKHYVPKKQENLLKFQLIA